MLPDFFESFIKRDKGSFKGREKFIMMILVRKTS